MNYPSDQYFEAAHERRSPPMNMGPISKALLALKDACYKQTGQEIGTIKLDHQVFLALTRELGIKPCMLHGMLIDFA